MRRRHATMMTLALTAPLVGGACTSGPPTPTVGFILAPLFPFGIMAASAPVAFSQRHGPTITIVNRSDAPIDARFWVAKVDASRAAGHDVMQTDDRLTVRIQPNELLYTDAGRPAWVTGQNDAVVWVRLIPAVADDVMNAPLVDGAPGVMMPASERPAIDPVWLEMTRPGPYKLEITGTLDADAPYAGLAYQALEETSFTLVPREDWIEHHDGRYPVASGGQTVYDGYPVR